MLEACVFGKDPNAGKDGGPEERERQRMRGLEGITDSRGREFEQALGDGEGQGSLAGCSPWGRRELDTTA